MLLQINQDLSGDDARLKLANRLTDIIEGSRQPVTLRMMVPYQKYEQGSGAWHLDNGNDWWLFFDEGSEQGLFRVVYRYNTPSNDREKMLARWLSYTLRATIVEDRPALTGEPTVRKLAEDRAALCDHEALMDRYTECISLHAGGFTNNTATTKHMLGKDVSLTVAIEVLHGEIMKRLRGQA